MQIGRYKIRIRRLSESIFTFALAVGCLVFLLEGAERTSNFTGKVAVPTAEQLIEDGPYFIERVRLPRQNGVFLIKDGRRSKVFVELHFIPPSVDIDKVIEEASGKAVVTAWFFHENKTIPAWRIKVGENEIVSYGRAMHFLSARVDTGWWDLKVALFLAIMATLSLINIRRTE